MRLVWLLLAISTCVQSNACVTSNYAALRAVLELQTELKTNKVALEGLGDDERHQRLRKHLRTFEAISPKGYERKFDFARETNVIKALKRCVDSEVELSVKLANMEDKAELASEVLEHWKSIDKLLLPHMFKVRSTLKGEPMTSKITEDACVKAVRRFALMDLFKSKNAAELKNALLLHNDKREVLTQRDSSEICRKLGIGSRMSKHQQIKAIIAEASAQESMRRRAANGDMQTSPKPSKKRKSRSRSPSSSPSQRRQNLSNSHSPPPPTSKGLETPSPRREVPPPPPYGFPPPPPSTQMSSPAMQQAYTSQQTPFSIDESPLSGRPLEPLFEEELLYYDMMSSPAMQRATASSYDMFAT